VVTLVKLEKERVAKLTWGERMIECPYWKRPELAENLYHSPLVQLEIQLQAQNETKKWRSVKERTSERREEGHQRFRRIRKLKNQALYGETEDPSHLSPIHEEINEGSDGDNVVAEAEGRRVLRIF
jgi:hypothetical protein